MNKKDLARVRELAEHQRELAGSSRNQRLLQDWERHGRMDGSGRPMITVELWTFEGEIVNPLLKCETPEGREIESLLTANAVNFELFQDDTFVRDYLPVSMRYDIVPFGLPFHRDESGGLGHHFVPQVLDLAQDFVKLGKSTVSKKREAFENRKERLETAVGDILPVRTVGSPFGFSPMGDIVRIMGMDNMYIAMCDEPELFHRMLDMLTGDYLSLMEESEKDGLLLPTAGDQQLPQGSYCFTKDLPESGTQLATTQIWGYLDSQETSGVSPEMYHEFVYPYYKRLSERYGLLSYGCCEGVHAIWEKSISRFENLRKVSISPWCDEAFMGHALQGRKVVFHRKPSPNFIGVERYMNEDAVRAAMEKTVSAAKGLTLEFSQRDVYTVHGDIGKVARYVELIREACEKKK